MPTKLNLHRRHLAACADRAKGWNYTLCNCPIWVDGTIDGKRFCRSLNTSDMALAMRRLGRLQRGEEQDFVPALPELTLGGAIRAYLQDARDRGLQESSLVSIGGVLGQFEKFVGDIPLTSVSGSHVARFRGRRTMTLLTQRKELEYLRGLFNFCVNQEWLQRSPARTVKLPLVKDNPVLPYSRDEVQALLRGCEQVRGMGAEDTPIMRQRAKALVLTMLYSGLRISDITVLRRTALDKTNHLVLRTAKNNVPIKALLPQDVADCLRALPAIGGNPTYFFWSGNGLWNSCSKVLWRLVSRLGEKAGVKAHPHRFRHTFAVELLSNGKDIRHLQLLLGHESIKTTEKHYGHFIAGHQALLDEAVSSLDFSSDAPRPLLVRPLHKRRRNS